MNAACFLCWLVALPPRFTYAAASGPTASGKSELTNRFNDKFALSHALGGVNYDLVNSVLSQVQRDTSDALVAIPTQLQQGGLFNNNVLLPGYDAVPYSALRPVFRPGVYFKGGGYRGVKSIPFPASEVHGGYRGGLPPSVTSGGVQIPKTTDAVHKPLRPTLPQNLLLVGDERPIRNGRLDKRPSWRPEVVLEIAQVIRDDNNNNNNDDNNNNNNNNNNDDDNNNNNDNSDDNNNDNSDDKLGQQSEELNKPAAQPPTNVNEPGSESGFEFEIAAAKPRPALVPVTTEGPPSKDFISKLEADLVAGLTPQQLEELSFQAIDPRKEKESKKRPTSSKILFPERVV